MYTNACFVSLFHPLPTRMYPLFVVPIAVDVLGGVFSENTLDVCSIMFDFDMSVEN